MSHILGIDVGGTGIKAALVDTQTGELVSDKIRKNTPQPATPDRIIEVIVTIINSFNYSDKIGICFPAIVENNIIKTANNIDPSWIGINLKEKLSDFILNDLVINNDADTAGLAEVTMGAGQGVMGKVITITIGTGLGSGLFYDGRLIPNVELGSLPYDNDIIERYVSKAVRKKEDLTWKEFGHRLNKFLYYIETILSPDLIIIGGGYSKKYNKYKDYITIQTEIVIARFENNAGIIGAALSACN